MNRLRPHFAKQTEQKAKKRLQKQIVAAYRDDIISLIADDGATLPEVVDAIRADGEVVLEAGFKAEVLRQIGTVKNIRAGRSDATAFTGGVHAPQCVPPHANTTSNMTTVQTDDDDDDDSAFVARRPRR